MDPGTNPVDHSSHPHYDLAMTEQQQSPKPSENFNVIIIGVGSVNFGIQGIHWNNTFHLEDIVYDFRESSLMLAWPQVTGGRDY